MTLIRIFCSALLAFATFTASAQSTPAASGAASAAPAAAASAPPSSPAKKALVAKVVALHQPFVEAAARSLAERPISNMAQAASQALAQMPADKREAAAKQVDTEVRKYLDDAVPYLRDRATKLAPSALGPLFDERFNEDELRTLVTWLESSTNKKYQQLSADVQTNFLQKLLADTRGNLEPKLKALGERVAVAVGQGPAPSADKPAAPGPGPGPAKPAASAASKAKP